MHDNNASNNVPAWLCVDTDQVSPAQAAPTPKESEPAEQEPSESAQPPSPKAAEQELERRGATWSAWGKEAAAQRQRDWQAEERRVLRAQREAERQRELEERRQREQRQRSSDPRDANSRPAGGAHRREESSRRESIVPIGAHDFAQSDSRGFNLTPPVALDQSNIVSPAKRPPRGGWRKTLYTLSFGLINLGDSEKDRQREAMLERIRTPLRGDYRIAVMSLKGGVGKTTTTVALGGVFAETRGDRVIAIDANPDLGTLAQRVAAPGSATIRDLLAAEDTSRYSQVKSYTTQAKSRLEVIGSERDPAVSEEFSESDYRDAISILRRHYSVILTDCGTGLMHSAMGGVLDLADALVLVTSAALDGAQSAAATLDWLNLHGYEQLAANSVVVVSSPPQQRSAIDMDQLVGHFRARTRAVQVIPYDPHLAEGASVDLELLARPTREAYKQLAATIAHDFSNSNR